MKFWDTSAILPLCVDEIFTEQMKGYLRDDQHIAAWWGTYLECVSTFSHLKRDGVFSFEEMKEARMPLEELSEHWTEIIPSRELRDQAARLISIHPLKAADSLQLSSAVIWAEYKTSRCVFVCLDKTLRTAARKEEFHVLPEKLEIH